MGNEENWNTFARTGKVSDYLTYVGGGSARMGDRSENAVREEGGRREGTCDGNGARGSYRW